MRMLVGLLGFALGATPALALPSNSIVYNVEPVPAIDELGLIALVVGVAVAGGIAVRRKSRRKDE